MFAAFLVATSVAACGGGGYGGGGGGYPPPTPQPGSLQFTGAVSVDEQAGTAQLTITRTGGSDNAVSVTVATNDGGARAGEDYTALNTTVSFAAGDAAAKTVTVSITDDARQEADETFVVSLLSPTGGAQLGAVNTAIVTIRDNDPAGSTPPTEPTPTPPPVVPPAAPTLAVSAAIKQLTFSWASVPGATSYRLLNNPDGVSGFTLIGAEYPSDAVSASVEVAVHRHDWLNALYRVEACNAGGCSGSNSVSAGNAMLETIGYFKASNAGAKDLFGNAIALSADGSTLAVGALTEDSNARGVGGMQDNDDARDSGAVYVFTRNGTQWSQQAYLKASNTGNFDNFGTAVALSADGGTLAVGAEFERSTAIGVDGDQSNNAGFQAGAVYVFTRTGAQWSQQAYLKASNTDDFDRFGFSVGLSGAGDTLAVGAVGESSSATGVDGDQGNDAVDAGAVYVFTRNGTHWSQQAYLKASNTGDFDAFGFALALSTDGNTLAVSALNESSEAAGDQNNEDAFAAGAVYMFTRAGAQWSQQAYVKASNAAEFDQFGFAVALSGDGGTLAVGATGEDSNAGAVYVFTRNGVDWSQQAYVKASNTDGNDQFGASVALSADGSTLAVGAIGEAGNAIGVGGDPLNNAAAGSGAVYVFTRDGVEWSQRAYVKASNTQQDDSFGKVVALSANASTLAVGAALEDGNATGIGADQGNELADAAGAVYIF